MTLNFEGCPEKGTMLLKGPLWTRSPYTTVMHERALWNYQDDHPEGREHPWSHRATRIYGLPSVIYLPCFVDKSDFRLFYALSASKVIFNARTYSHITFSVRWWLLLDEWNYEKTYLDVHLTKVNSADKIAFCPSQKFLCLKSDFCLTNVNFVDKSKPLAQRWSTISTSTMDQHWAFNNYNADVCPTVEHLWSNVVYTGWPLVRQTLGYI